MTRQQIEQVIMKVIVEETTAIGVSDKLFTPDGLFSLLAGTKEERRDLVQTPLFKQAQQRFRELQFKEAGEFQQAVATLKGTGLAENYRMRIERIKSD